MKHPLFITSTTEKKIKSALSSFKKAIDERLPFNSHQKNVILLKGPPGTGKTYSISIIIQEMSLQSYVRRDDMFGKRSILIIDTDSYLDITRALEQNYHFYIIETRSTSSLNRFCSNKEYSLRIENIQFLPVSFFRFKKSMKNFYEFLKWRRSAKGVVSHEMDKIESETGETFLKTVSFPCGTVRMSYKNKSSSYVTPKTIDEGDRIDESEFSCCGIPKTINEVDRAHARKETMSLSCVTSKTIDVVDRIHIRRAASGMIYDSSIKSHLKLTNELVQPGLPLKDTLKIIFTNTTDKIINLNHFEYLSIPNFYTSQYLPDTPTSFFHLLGKVFHSKVPDNIYIDHERVLDFIFTNYLKFIVFKQQESIKQPTISRKGDKKQVSDMKHRIINESYRISRIASDPQIYDHMKYEKNKYDYNNDLSHYNHKKYDDKKYNHKKYDDKKSDHKSFDHKKYDMPPHGHKSFDQKREPLFMDDGDIRQNSRVSQQELNTRKRKNKNDAQSYSDISISDIELTSSISDEYHKENITPVNRNHYWKSTLASLKDCFEFIEQISFTSFINHEELILIFVNRRENQKAYVQFKGPVETRFNYNNKWEIRDIS